MAGLFRKLEIVRADREAAGAVVLGFAPEDREAFRFRPGQYLTLRAEIDGVAEQRCYSICSAPDGATVDVAVKPVPGGRFSEWATRALKPGMRIDVMPPEGRFGVEPNAASRKRYLAIAAGSGVTPILSLARAILAEEPESTFTFVYGNRTLGSIMFREALDDLKDRHLDRFALVHVLSGEAQDVELFHGRIDRDRLRRLEAAGLIAPAEADAIFVSGPGDMLDTVKDAMTEAGADPGVIQIERFLATPGGGPAAGADAAARQTSAARVTAIYDGAARSFDLLPTDVSVILAAERAGVELPSSCRGGMCCTCRARVVEGEAAMAVNYSLEDWELDAGFVLACQTLPKAGDLTLDFDAV